MENKINRGISRGEICTSTNPTQIAVLMIAIIEGALMQAKLTQRTRELKIAMDYLEKMILGLKA